MTQLKKNSKIIFFLISSWFFFLPEVTLAAFTYTPMEAIPGFGRSSSLGDYVLAIYKFGLWTIGISAVLMISIGAFTYITSAGNASQIKNAKDFIFDAIMGVFLALISYVLLYTINPALVTWSW